MSEPEHAPMAFETFVLMKAAVEAQCLRSEQLTRLIEDCPLLFTSTCNAAELTWIARARRVLAGEDDR